MKNIAKLIEKKKAEIFGKTILLEGKVHRFPYHLRITNSAGSVIVPKCNVVIETSNSVEFIGETENC